MKLSSKVGRGYERGRYFEEIRGAKGDVGALSVRDILRKDYKQWSEDGRVLGISSVVKPISFLVEKASSSSSSSSLASETASFAEARNLSLYAIMTAFTSEGSSEGGKFQRELLIECGEEMRDVVERFEKEAKEELELEEMEMPSGVEMEQRKGEGEEEKARRWRKVWRQKEVGMSRKQVAPLLRKVVSGGDSR